MKNFLSGGGDKSFVDCVQALSRSLENRNGSPELRDLFFKLIEKRDQLPDNIPEEITNNFIYCLVEISYSDPDDREALRAINSLFRFLKSDVNVFTHFKPSRILIRRLKLDKYLINSSSDIMENVLDFAIFLLRYYEAVDYEDFSDLATINAKIKRAEIHRVWIDIEEIIGRLDGLDQTNKQNINNTSAAFGEVFSYIDKLKKDYETSKLAPKAPDNDYLQGRPQIYDRGGPSQANPYLNGIGDNRKGDDIERKLNDFGSKIDRLKFPDKADAGYQRPDNLSAVKGGFKNDDPIDNNKDARNQIEEIKKMVNVRLGKIESDLALVRSAKAGLPEGDSSEIVQNLLGAINNLTERVGVLERGNPSVLASRGINPDPLSFRPLGDLDLKIKVGALEKKLENLEVKTASTYSIIKIPSLVSEIDKLKQDFLALEARMSKDLSHVSDALRKGDYAMFEFQSDLQRLMDMVALMQKDIQDLQNYPVDPSSVQARTYDPDPIKKRLSALELRVDKQPTRTELDNLLNRLSDLEKQAGPVAQRLDPSSVRKTPDDYANNFALGKPSGGDKPVSTVPQVDLSRFETKITELDKKVNDNYQTLMNKIYTLEKNVSQLQSTASLPINQPGNYPGSQPGNYPGNQPGNQPGNLPGNQSGKLPGNQSGNLPIGQPGNQLNQASVDPAKITALENQLGLLKQEVAQLKSGEANKDASRNSKLDVTSDVDRIERFVQEFVNKQAIIKIKRLMHPATPATQKMNKYEWIIRNLEFLSPNLPQGLLSWTQETIIDPSEQNPNRDALTIVKHNSEVMTCIVELVRACLETQNSTLKDLLDSYLAFGEVLLFSDSNLEKGVQYGIVDMLFHILDPTFKYTEDERRGALKCVLPCSRSAFATNIIFSSNKNLQIICGLMARPWDNDSLLILTNFLSKAFTENTVFIEQKFGSIQPESRELVNVLFVNLAKYENTPDIIEEILQALINLTQKPQNLELIKEPQSLAKVAEIAKKTKQQNLKEYSMAVLKNSAKKPAFNDYIKSQGITV